MVRTKRKLLNSTANVKPQRKGEQQRKSIVVRSTGRPENEKPTPKQERAPKKATRVVRPPVRGPPIIQPLAFSIQQFCAAHGISIDTYFKMQRAGTGPRVMKARARTLISQEAAAEWRRAREEAAQEQRHPRAQRTEAASATEAAT
jgi:hypothetical protein